MIVLIKTTRAADEVWGTGVLIETRRKLEGKRQYVIVTLWHVVDIENVSASEFYMEDTALSGEGIGFSEIIGKEELNAIDRQLGRLAGRDGVCFLAPSPAFDPDTFIPTKLRPVQLVENVVRENLRITGYGGAPASLRDPFRNGLVKPIPSGTITNAIKKKDVDLYSHAAPNDFAGEGYSGAPVVPDALENGERKERVICGIHFGRITISNGAAAHHVFLGVKAIERLLDRYGLYCTPLAAESCFRPAADNVAAVVPASQVPAAVGAALPKTDNPFAKSLVKITVERLVNLIIPF